MGFSHTNGQRLMDEAVVIWKPVSVVCLAMSAALWVNAIFFAKPPASSPEPAAEPIASPSPSAPVQKRQAQVPMVKPGRPSVEQPQSPPPAVSQRQQDQAIIGGEQPKPMPPVSNPVPATQPAAVVVATARPEAPVIPQKPKDEWAEYTAQMRSAISADVLRKAEADVLAALSLECSSVTQSLRVAPGGGTKSELIVVIARFRLASNPKQPGKSAWSQSYGAAASIDPKLFQGISSPDTIERIIQDLKENLLADKETLAKLQASVTP